MTKFQFLIFVITTFIFTGCIQESNDPTKSKFSGLWKLVIIEKQDPESLEWSEYNNGMQGYILYDDKDNMAVHLTSKGYQNTDIIFHDFDDTVLIEELKHRTQSYVYFAKYTVYVKEKYVEHARISHSNPNQWNVAVKRSFEFIGDTLKLTTIDRKAGPLRVTWLRY